MSIKSSNPPCCGYQWKIAIKESNLRGKREFPVWRVNAKKRENSRVHGITTHRHPQHRAHSV